MKNNSVAFITCVNDEEMYEECCRYIDNLNVPIGYEIEKIPIRNSISMASGYNEAIKRSKSRYKVYLHQDVFIINKNFIQDSLNIFQKDQSIGLLGVIGTKILPTSAIWWESIHLIGKTYEIRQQGINLLHFNDTQDEEHYCEVQYVDGLIMMTQFDVKWREDIFNGWHFYDISQCIEFKNAGYKVIIPNQENPWCIHDCGVVNVEKYEEYRQIFLETYSKDIFPLVSILIPTHNRPEYFKIALESAVNQTYRNIEIIISDDGIDEKTLNIVQEKYLVENNNIKYFNNQKNLGQVENVLKLLNLANAKYINFLYDDDVFKVNKIEVMMNYFIQYESYGIALVTSDRNLIDENGNIIKRFLGETFFNNNVLICLGKELAESVIKNHYNIIGEPTTVLFNKEKLTENFAHCSGRKFLVNIALASWFNLIKNGNVVIINDSLSSLRQHKNQISQDSSLTFNDLEENVFFVLTAKSNGFFEKDMAYKEALEYCINYVNNVSQRENIIEKSNQLLDKLNAELEKVMGKNKYGIDFRKIGDNVIIEDQCVFVHSEKISIGKAVHISEKSKFVVLYPNGTNESKLIIDDCCKIGKSCSVFADNKIVIEKKVTIGNNVHIVDLYEYNNVGIPILTDGNVFVDSNIIIKHGAQIADNVVIKGNVKIGRNSIIEANSVVLSDIPDRCVAMGIPAKVKEIFDYETGKWIKVGNEKELKVILEKRNNIKPILTIGIPTYNRSKYLKKCLDVIYDDIGDEPLVEVLVSDNCSTDNTESITKEYEYKYSNFKYYKNDTNIGGARNFEKVFELFTGEYVNLHGDDDYFNNNVINNIIKMLYDNRDCGIANIVREKCDFNIIRGTGINEYMLCMLNNITFITNLIISKREYNKIIDNNRWNDNEYFPQIYIQCQILSLNENFCILKGDMLDIYSGNAALESISIAEKEGIMNHHISFGKLFIEKYLTLLNECIKYGLTFKTLQVLKERNVDMVIIPQMYSYKNLNIDCDYVEVIEMFKKYYSKESYYQMDLNKIKEIINS